MCPRQSDAGIAVLFVPDKSAFDFAGRILFEFGVTYHNTVDLFIYRELLKCFEHICFELLRDVGYTHFFNLLLVNERFSTQPVLVAFLVPRRIHNDFVDVWDDHYIILDFLRINVLAVFQNDNVLFATRDGKLTLIVEVAVITGSEPTVVQYFGCTLRIVVISEHDIIAFHAYFSVAGFIRIIDSDFDAGNGITDRIVGKAVKSVYGNTGGTLGYAVCIDNRHPDIVKKLADLRAYRRAPDAI